MSVVSQMQSIIAIIEQYELKSVIHTEAGEHPGIHLSDPNEVRKFNGVQSRERYSAEFPTELWTEIDGVRVFSLVPFKANVAS